MKYALILLTALTVTWSPAADKKVVVIGFDGADYRVTQEMLEKGELPNLKKLQEMGGFSSLLPTNPPQTPVSWSTFATGINPGRTGIFDFIKRKEGTYFPDYALRNEVSTPILFGPNNPVVLPLIVLAVMGLLLLLILRPKRSLPKWAALVIVAGGLAFGTRFVAVNWLPEAMPGAGQVRQGIPIWKILEEKGMTAGIFRLPVTFPAEPLNGEMIPGLGVPDIRAFVGTPSIYTNDPEWETGENKFSINIVNLSGEAPYQTQILGPPNKLFYDREEEQQAKLAGRPYNIPKDFHEDLTITTHPDHVTLTIEGRNYEVKLKEWSPWIEFNYKINPLITVTGFGRFFLDRLDTYMKLYLTPIHLHPKNPMPLSYPKSLGREEWAKEPYKTMGWALDTWSIADGYMDEDHFLEDIELTVARFERMMEDFLKDNDRDLFVQVFSFTDRIGHIFWRFLDEGHPLYDPAKAEKYAAAFRESYIRMDGIVGKAMDLIDFEDTVLLVCSDHGFASFRHQFNYNTWLVKNGYMKLKKNVLGQSMELSDLTNQSTPFSFVDWENTKAYAMGLGMVFINLEGREPNGSVKQADYEAVCEALKRDLEAFVDEKTGLKPVREVHFRDNIYRLYDPGVTPDLRVATAPNYRVSWDTTLGGMPFEMTEDNHKNWSGDHCSMDPRDVPGIFFSSRKPTNTSPAMADMCPTMLDLLGVTTDIDMDGKSVFR